jgi:hypothetical protein
MNKALELKVQCYAGYQGEETPQRFSIGKRVIEITAILDRWLAPAHRYFKVKGDDDGVYILRYDVDADRWEMTLFDSGRRDETRLSGTAKRDT